MKRRHMRKTGHCSLLCFASIVILLQTFATATLVFGQTGQTYTFITVDVPLPDGQLGSTSLGDINDQGQIAGGFANSNLGPYGFILNFNKKGKMRSTEIKCPGKNDVTVTEPQSINSQGEITGFVNAPGKISGFFRSSKCVLIDYPGGNLTEASGLNDAGQVVGDYRDAKTGIFHGFLWDAGQFLTIDVPFPGAVDTAPTGINNVGQIVGFWFDNNVTPSFPNGRVHGFLNDNGVFTSFDFPGADSTLLFDINDNGQILGIFGIGTESIGHSFVLDHGTFSTFDVPFAGVVGTNVRGINNQGQIVGRYIESNPSDLNNPFPSHGFVASPSVNSPLVASLTEGQPLDPKPAIPQVANAKAAGSIMLLCDTTRAALALALSKAGLCTTGVTDAVPGG